MLYTDPQLYLHAPLPVFCGGLPIERFQLDAGVDVELCYPFFLLMRPISEEFSLCSLEKLVKHLWKLIEL